MLKAILAKKKLLACVAIVVGVGTFLFEYLYPMIFSDSSSSMEVHAMGSAISNFTGPTGDKEYRLTNVGNSCYMNSTLQIFLNIEKLSSVVLSVSDKTLDVLETCVKRNDEQERLADRWATKEGCLKTIAFIRNYKTILDKQINHKRPSRSQLKKLASSISDLNETFVGGRQCDAAELFTLVQNQFALLYKLMSRSYLEDMKKLHKAEWDPLLKNMQDVLNIRYDGEVNTHNMTKLGQKRGRSEGLEEITNGNAPEPKSHIHLGVYVEDHERFLRVCMLERSFANNTVLDIGSYIRAYIKASAHAQIMCLEKNGSSFTLLSDTAVLSPATQYMFYCRLLPSKEADMFVMPIVERPKQTDPAPFFFFPLYMSQNKLNGLLEKKILEKVDTPPSWTITSASTRENEYVIEGVSLSTGEVKEYYTYLQTREEMYVPISTDHQNSVMCPHIDEFSVFDKNSSAQRKRPAPSTLPIYKNLKNDAFIYFEYWPGERRSYTPKDLLNHMDFLEDIVAEDKRMEPAGLVLYLGSSGNSSTKTSGHYTAAIKLPNHKWLYLDDDDSPKSISFEQLLQKRGDIRVVHYTTILSNIEDQE
ncbi:hypothetical protein NECID01_0135 [Nematocida sp. AWRm77]|nr:hypothetical protein NECID01_0135 [Nematocida sp. AWRm77]